MIDFSALVLGPAMAVFGQPITVTPTASQPGQPAYAAVGVFAAKPVEIAYEGGDGFHQALQPELGIRLSDYPVPPKQNDTIACGGASYVVFNVIKDGQGGAKLMLRETD